MFRAGQLAAAAAFRAPFGARAVSSMELKVIVGDSWYASDPQFGTALLSRIGPGQWEARGLDRTPITQLVITSAGVHTSSDKKPHFTGRAFDVYGNAVWFLDKLHLYYTNGIHFYPDGLPPDYDNDRFDWTPSDNEELVKWCIDHRRDIKTGKKI